jgi:hypothetical protein
MDGDFNRVGNPAVYRIGADRLQLRAEDIRLVSSSLRML